ncbi:FdhF/YdeP family oxidoreductase [Methylopila sp. Yamaguchi]|uniref:FdhF/YdeP family oxidoreductase n=1 Tax=Methylopila sp. Yamaguchi TaxID=1437817 RepID=UPI000CCBF12C|nr:FdhF/YdeP family oxidoreductase [Methylopila sp. Yamaguchi]
MTKPKIDPYEGPAGGWGSAGALAEIITREKRGATGPAILAKQNKPDGFMCVSCAWAKPAEPLPFEYCENGAKATAWELTRRRVAREFFETHTVTELLGWSDYALEEQGRLTEPMRYDPQTDKYEPVSWDDAIRDIGADLASFAPASVVFYASGRAALETSYMYALLARLYGTNNLPDSSNMCHESTSVALPQSIGVPVGTTTLADFEHVDLIMFFGQNVGSNSPRMLHQLQEARRRGAEIITFNPLRERGLERFTNPQSPVEMLTGAETTISTQYHQVKAGGDLAALAGICKALLEQDDAAVSAGRGSMLDLAFIAEHTHGFESFVTFCRHQTWDAIERRSGLKRDHLQAVAEVYARSRATMGVYGMGLTQHRLGVETIQMLVNLLLLKGNIGKPGAGVCPVRGHSNVQGQRTVGITEKPELAPLDKLAEQYGFTPPRDKGMTTVEVCEALVAEKLDAFIGLGGNFARAAPDSGRTEPAWGRVKLTVQIATKLNRGHLLHGQKAYILPCLGRIEIDEQETGPQAVSMEDSTSFFHGSRGMVKPASPHLRSEPWIVAQLAKATLPPNPRVPWDRWTADYATVREAMAETYPALFTGFNETMFTPGGVEKPLAARERRWETDTGKANFATPPGLEADPDIAHGDDVLTLITIRSNDQFNTTVYGYNDRFRGVSGTRRVLFMNPADIARLGFSDGDFVEATTCADDGPARTAEGLRVVAYSVPEGCCAGYYPELNVLLPIWHHDAQAKTPAAKAIPVRLAPSQPCEGDPAAEGEL